MKGTGNATHLGNPKIPIACAEELPTKSIVQALIVGSAWRLTIGLSRPKWAGFRHPSLLQAAGIRAAGVGPIHYLRAG